MLLALHNGTPEQIAEKTFTKQYTRQILCIAENIIEIHTSANPGFGTNIKGHNFFYNFPDAQEEGIHFLRKNKFATAPWFHFLTRIA